MKKKKKKEDETCVTKCRYYNIEWEVDIIRERVALPVWAVLANPTLHLLIYERNRVEVRG